MFCFVFQTFTNEITAHQADLRFINMAGQRFIEEAKAYSHNLRAFAADLKIPGPQSAEPQNVKDAVRVANERYQSIVGRCNSYLDKLNNAGEQSRKFKESTEKMNSWLTYAEQTAAEMKAEAVKSEPRQVEEQLERLKAFNNDVLTQTKRMEDVRKLGKSLSEAMQRLGSDITQLDKIDDTTTQLGVRLEEVTALGNARTNILQTALVQSQGVQEGVESLLSWLKDTESMLNNMRPVSLNTDNLAEQMQEQRTVSIDIASHQPSVESIKQKGDEFLKNCDPKTAQTIRTKLADVDKKFDVVFNKCKDRGSDLVLISGKLTDFNEAASRCEDWLLPAIETLESRETAQLGAKEYNDLVKDIAAQREEKLEELEGIRSLGQELITSTKTGEVAVIKDMLAGLETYWHDLSDILSDKIKEAEVRSAQSGKFDTLSKEVTTWLDDSEGKVDSLQPVAILPEVINAQMDELQPIMKEHEVYAAKVDELNDIGNRYDALQRGDQASSPIRRVSK